MQNTENLLPVESDVNQYLHQDRFMFDNDVSDLFKKFRIKSLLNYANIKKRTGHPTNRIVYDLFFIPFLMFSNVFLFVRAQYENAQANKNRFYRLLENAEYNWCSFILNLSYRVNQAMHVEPKEIARSDEKSTNHGTEFFVVDDTITSVSGKLIELTSYVYDHVKGKSVLGFQKLVLGLFNGSHFIPISKHICTSKKKPNAKSKATKYKKIPKSERIHPDSPGAWERASIDQTKLDKVISMLRQALKKGFKASTVLFDSWFCFNSFIIKIVDTLKLNVICQLKNMPRTNKYLYKGKCYSLKELFGYYAKPRLRMIKKHQLKRSILVVGLPGSKIQLKIVFIQNEGEEKWHAFAATDTRLSAITILEYYSQRWSIEVFFKNCKQYLNFGKEQMSNLDSIIACDALVFMRYIFLTYLAYQHKSTFYDKFDAIRDVHTVNTFGMRLLKFFLNKILFVVREACALIRDGFQEKAVELLESYMNDPCEPVPIRA
ncbi:MAG: transposase [Candidatus Marinimicrobia bacterium]|nr:transposase [Candidatus Neomarinimicrobiota bacterium]